MNMIFLATLLLGLAVPIAQALKSPCPELLTYETKAPDLPARWYALITFPPEISTWQQITIDLDTKAHLLGSEVGDVSTDDNINFIIDNDQPTIESESLRFFVKHDPDDAAPPSVKEISLNGQTICSTVKDKATALQRPFDEPKERLAAPAQEPTGTRAPGRLIAVDRPSHLVPVFDVYEEPQCGTVKLNNPVALVVDGGPTLEGQWPWQVALYRLKEVDYKYICAGTLVSRRHVITAAHCTTVPVTRPVQKIDVASLSVYLGKHDLRASLEGVQFRLVKEVTVHPDFDSWSLSRDLSILLLRDPVQYTNWVQPVCLWPEGKSNIEFIINKKGSVVGWGGDGSGKLKLAHMIVVSQETCLRAKPDFYGRVTSEYTFCAGQSYGSGFTCNGDSGGGMVFRINMKWHLRGVVSLAKSKHEQNICDPQYYAVFTDVAKYLPWIQDNIEPF